MSKTAKVSKPVEATVSTKTAKTAEVVKNPLGVQATNGKLSVEERTKWLLVQRHPEMRTLRNFYINCLEPECDGVLESLEQGGDYAGRYLIKSVEADLAKIAKCDKVECRKLECFCSKCGKRGVVTYVGLPKPRKSSRKEQEDMGPSDIERDIELCMAHEKANDRKTYEGA
jgi:hypothetical protein